MARLLVVHDTRADVYAEIIDDGEEAWDYRCTCNALGSDEGVRGGNPWDVVEAAQIHVDRTHGSL